MTQVHRAAIQDVRGAAGKAAGEVAQRAVGGEAAGLHLAQMGNVADADRQLHHVEHADGVAEDAARGKPRSGRATL